jgi:hypothetical protein
LRKSPIFKEHFAQSIRKTVLGAPGLTRAEWFCSAGSGVAPTVYYMGRVKRVGGCGKAGGGWRSHEMGLRLWILEYHFETSRAPRIA